MPRIPESEIELLKSSLSLVRLIEAAGHVLKPQGKDLAMRCPLHEGDATPSFVVTPGKNVWHCFGCQRGGSVIDWVMASRHVSFRHAVELLQGDSPALLAPVTTAVRTAAAAFAPSADEAALLHQVIDHYHATLQASPEAQTYLAQRGLDHPDLIATFRLGYANRTLGYRLPEKNRMAGAELRGALQRIGLLRESGHEHFAGSLVIPVFDAAGNVAEVYGRKVNDHLRAGTPKHLYLPGPHRGVFNAAGLKGCETVILCEAMLDALTFWCAGFRNVTSAFGVSGVTDELLQMLVANGTQRVLIAFDADDAGNSAAEALAPTLIAHGLAPLRVHFPKGMDANAYALKVGPADKALGLVLEQAVSMGNAPPLRVPVPPSLVAAVAVEAEAAAKEAPAAQPAPIDEAALSAPLLPAPSAENALEVAGPDDLRFTRGPRSYRVRGLARNLSAESLKVTLRLSAGEHLHLDTLDLYQARQRGAFVKTAAIELGVAESVIAGDLSALVLALEPMQEQAIRGALQPAVPELPPLTEADETVALAWLRDPQLVERLVEDVARCGLVGEPVNVLVGYLACVSRLLPQPLAILIQSTSAAGKSALMDAVLHLVPEQERVHYSAMTGQSLFYLGEHDLKHKILAIAEEEGVRQAAYALKLLQSQGELTIASTGKDPATGKLVTAEYRVEGPVMLFLTTTAIEIDEELLNRCLVLTIDESREQTRAIQAAQRSRRTLAGLLATHAAEDIASVHRNAQRLLRPLAVVNPFAEQLGFLDERTRTRRDQLKYLTLIDAIALLHQHQRTVRSVEHRGQVIEYVEVLPADIALANRLAHEVLGRSLDELPPQTRRVLGVIAGLVAARMAEQAQARSDVRLTRRELRGVAGITDTALRLHLERLVEMEYLLVHRSGQRFVYELLFDGDLAASTPQLVGLIDVEALQAAATTATAHPADPDRAPRSHPGCTPLAPPLQGVETARNASAGAESSPLVAAVPEIARDRTARVPRRRRNGSAAVATAER